jgi:hypothetical protein
MILQGIFKELLPPLTVFPRLVIEEGAKFKGVRIDHECIFLIPPAEAAKLAGVAPGYEIEVDANQVPISADDPASAQHVYLTWRPENM